MSSTCWEANCFLYSSKKTSHMVTLASQMAYHLAVMPQKWVATTRIVSSLVIPIPFFSQSICSNQKRDLLFRSLTKISGAKRYLEMLDDLCSLMGAEEEGAYCTA
ncbi:hypothetical protein PHYBLDRAFT_143815 [Phycomyces blakesleeanus NRRL 1555(-)]|uniref:Uncharacterized protein n=1 Tax=Phycomyces blakesleeanus (strain ATCC 8743b / DSM 1359 / FGSC 10004 / NBRC 33097 / NRRL 1555) TaxID=763407 RepID=A0A163ASY3_PHYB8|nr:hypothetical protein PHYBLDRAFT_143815 [Phycomyces blakesleeanus NRRL 1555(-)]OAD75571.1 hypothetical protein PHYBLDRAFT_143815 [Phycomyces blakesleeanus NRRL 1555(-)]|eukprot:XP_018293611.1 hypothetical protein PHYBLDRAFT_143815 [Phycomyces blakesleeanus NRRL 1555(-)]